MHKLSIKLMPLVIITLAVLIAMPNAVVDCVRYAIEGTRWLFNKITSGALKFVFSIAGLVGAMSVMAAETSTGAGLSEGIGFFTLLHDSWNSLPLYVQILGVVWLFVPVFSFIVSATDTPTDDRIWGKWIYPIIEKLALVAFKSKQLPGDGYLLKPHKKPRK